MSKGAVDELLPFKIWMLTEQGSRPRWKPTGKRYSHGLSELSEKALGGHGALCHKAALEKLRE